MLFKTGNKPKHWCQTLCALLLTSVASQALAQEYGFIFKGEDLNAGERIHVAPPHAGGAPGIQQFGYDFGAFRHTSGNTWSRLKANGVGTNPQDHVIYGIYDGQRGLPFYAMADGEVIGCWRNSPNDPAADKLSKVIGGGNHLWIRQDDGRIALYAHAAAGSIPNSVCPYNEVYTVNDWAPVANPDIFPESYVPRGVGINVATGTILRSGERVVRPRVRRGQLLGRVGYTGSTGRTPHIHIHMESGGSPSMPLPIRFANGLTSPVTKVVNFNTMEANINQWVKLTNGNIPNGNQFIWPARTLTDEYARHKYPAEDFQRLFQHLADSGFWLDWLDTYSVAGKSYMNFTWRPNQGAWRAYALIGEAQFQQVFTQAENDGFEPWQVESSVENGTVLYSAVFRKSVPGAYMASHGMTVQQHDAFFAMAVQNGMSPISDSVVSVGGQRFFTTLYRSNVAGSWVLKPIVNKNDYQTLYNQQSANGFFPRYVQAYKHNNQVYYSVIFSNQSFNDRIDRHDMSATEYQQEYDFARDLGLLTQTVSGVDNAISNHEYIAVWKD